MSGPKTNERPGTRAQGRHLKGSASKARRVLNLIRNESVEDARTILQFSETGVSEVISKILESAVANANHNDGLDEDELYVAACFADEGATMKRFRPRARGRASRINKRTSHITVIVARYENEELEERREKAAARGTTSAAQAEARRRRVQRSQGAAEDTASEVDDDHAEDSAEQPERSEGAIANESGTDLTDINGIGPKFAEQLVAAGVANIAALAAISDDKKAELAEDLKGDDIDAWVEEAQSMSAASEEEE